MYTHRGAYLNALGNVIETGLTAESVFLWTLPMFHCNGWCFPWAVVAVGGHSGLPAQGRTWPGLGHLRGLRGHPLQRRAHRPHSASPTTRPRTGSPARSRSCVGGAPPSPTLLARLRALNFRPIHVYGLTETYAPFTVCAWHPEWAALSD